MSKQLNVPSNADETTPDETPAEGGIQFTARELAIAEDRDPDAAEEAELAASQEDEQEQPAGEVADTQVSDPPADTPAAPWYSSRDVQYAEKHGLSEWHLDQFGSREEFGRAAAMLEAAASRRQPEPKPEPTPKAPEKEPEYVDAATVDGKVNVEWFKRHDYDEGTIAAMQAQRDWQDRIEKQFADQESAAEQQRQAMLDAEEQRQLHAFHQAVDQARPDFYGVAYDEYGNINQLSEQQLQRRQELMEEVYWLSKRIEDKQLRSGMQVAIPSYQQLIKQAEVRAFGDELNRKTREQQLAAAKAQARTIRPAAGSVGAGTAKRNPSPPSDDPKSLAQDPDIIAAWAKAEAR